MPKRAAVSLYQRKPLMATKVTRKSAFESVRYEIDHLLCPKGWAQIDSSSDASWYGSWAHAEERSLVIFCEGDMTIYQCDTDQDFCDEIHRLAAFHEDEGGIRIDPVNGSRQSWEAIGLGDLLHKTTAELVSA